MYSTRFYNKFHKKSRIQAAVLSEKNFTYRTVLAVINETIHDDREIKILDYGCGVGAVSLFLADRGNDVIGIDISGKAVKTANKSAELMQLAEQAIFYTVDKGIKKIKNQKFDLIICIEVIEHVEDDKGLLSYFARLLKKGGLLIISTPSVNAPLYKMGLAEKFDKRVGHLRRYDSRNLVGMLRNTGFRVENVVKTEGILRNSLFLFQPVGVFVRFIRGTLSDFVTFIDNITTWLFGESDIFVISRKL